VEIPYISRSDEYDLHFEIPRTELVMFLAARVNRAQVEAKAYEVFQKYGLLQNGYPRLEWDKRGALRTLRIAAEDHGVESEVLAGRLQYDFRNITSSDHDGRC